MKTVLDIGCGWGGLARELRNKFNLDVTCLSNSPQQIDYIGSDFKTILADADTFKTDFKASTDEAFGSLEEPDDSDVPF